MELAMRSRLVAGLLIGLTTLSAHAQDASYDPWPDIAASVFDGRPIREGDGVIALEAPYRAEDAAIVPMTIRSELPAGSPLRIERITLVIDNNPSPVAAVFTLGSAGVVHAIETRVRVDSYTNVHAVAELSDGTLHGVQEFVKASGGCSAPASKDLGESAAVGEMKFRRFGGGAAGGSREVQIMIRHPNNSGLQMDPIHLYYIPAFFVEELTLTLGDDLLFRMEAGISISQNPTFRVSYSGFEDGPAAAEAVDTKDNVYRKTWAAGDGDQS